MHVYSCSGEDRSTTYLWLAALGILAAYLLHHAFVALGLTLHHLWPNAWDGQPWSPPWWLDTPASAGFFGIFYKMFDRCGWRWQFGSIRLSDVPDLRGTWAVKGHSSHSAAPTFYAVLHVYQTWTRISIRLETEGSTSASNMATVGALNSSYAGLRYEYLNQPKALSASTMQMHRGVADLTLSAGSDVLDGDYYSGRGRKQRGTLHGELLDRAILSRQAAFQLAGFP